MSRPLGVLAALSVVLGLAAAPGAAHVPGRADTSASAVSAQNRIANAGGVRLSHRIIGRGRALVLVQGLSGTMDAWEPAFVDGLVRAGHKVVLVDNEGMGRSDLRPGKLTIRRMGDDVAALVRRLRLGRVDVLGYSMGGMIAQSLAVRHPSVVRRLVLAATAPGDGTVVPTRRAALDVLLNPGASPFAQLGLLFPRAAEAARDRYVRGITRRPGAQPSGPPAVTRRQLAASAEWLAGRDADGRRVRRLRLPVLVGGGRRDQLLPYENQRRLFRAIAGATLVSYDTASHGFLFHQAADFVRRVDRFLDR